MEKVWNDKWKEILRVESEEENRLRYLAGISDQMKFFIENLSIKGAWWKILSGEKFLVTNGFNNVAWIVECKGKMFSMRIKLTNNGDVFVLDGAPDELQDEELQVLANLLKQLDCIEMVNNLHNKTVSTIKNQDYSMALTGAH